jgi:hypothetical protein
MALGEGEPSPLVFRAQQEQDAEDVRGIARSIPLEQMVTEG